MTKTLGLTPRRPGSQCAARRQAEVCAGTCGSSSTSGGASMARAARLMLFLGCAASSEARSCSMGSSWAPPLPWPLAGTCGGGWQACTPGASRPSWQRGGACWSPHAHQTPSAACTPPPHAPASAQQSSSARHRRCPPATGSAPAPAPGWRAGPRPTPLAAAWSCAAAAARREG